MKLTSFILLVLFIALTSLKALSKCGRRASDGPSIDEKPSGGYCGYNHHYYKAIVTEITKDEGEGGYRFKWKTESNSNVIAANSNAKGDFISLENYYKLSLKVGDALTYVESNIISGSCTPFLNDLRMERFPYSKDTVIR